MLKNLAKKEGIAILISSHILAEMQNLCDTIGIIDNGILIDTAPISKYKNTVFGSQFIKCGSPNYAGKLIRELFNIEAKVCGNKVLFTADETTLSKIIIALTEKRIAVFGAGEVDASLEDIFLSVVNDGKADTGIK